jgi:hypothetical protein
MCIFRDNLGVGLARVLTFYVPVSAALALPVEMGEMPFSPQGTFVFTAVSKRGRPFRMGSIGTPIVG